MDLKISQLLEMQRELQEKYLEKWGGVYPEKGASQLLWGIGEIGEVIDILKKRGTEEIMHDPVTRAHFVEELSDVMMYLCDVMLCFDINAQEYSEAHAKKHAHNMQRDYVSENRHLFDKKSSED